MPPLVDGPGWYMTRDGRRVRVDHNFDGWLDGLPFAVFDHGRYATPSYTVNEDGFLYPADHPLFRDKEGDEPHNLGMWQPDMFRTEPQPRYEMRSDLVQKAKEQ